MTAPDRIWAYGGECTGFSHRGWDDRSCEPAVEYIRRDAFPVERLKGIREEAMTGAEPGYRARLELALFTVLSLLEQEEG